ncbi:hypothetical protein LSAT2_016854 [Lamellibrachia satsuma]|nr:hypothetical protein LSAT2_016854 [Lamellibrachia satsuma]
MAPTVVLQATPLVAALVQEYEGDYPRTQWKAQAIKSLRRAVFSTTHSGASTVAIDNKIEQAMDLVKSHLMFAVREEVEVLKEQIKELLEKNNQLEFENNLLKASASPDTLAALQSTQPPPPQQNQQPPPAT